MLLYIKHMKPLFRITIGSVSNHGYHLAKLNYKLLKKNYPEADVVFCYNNIHEKFVKRFDYCSINQKMYINSISIKPFKESWKLYPPRLRIESHEVVLDNDVLLFKRIPEIDEFLSSNKGLMLYAERRVYGSFDGLIEKKLNINSGIFGLPPNYDFAKNIEKFLKKRPYKKKFNFWCDDQGIVAGCLQDIPYIMIKSVTNHKPQSYISTKNFYSNGVHLIGSNRNLSDKNFNKILDSLLI